MTIISKRHITEENLQEATLEELKGSHIRMNPHFSFDSALNKTRDCHITGNVLLVGFLELKKKGGEEMEVQKI